MKFTQLKDDIKEGVKCVYLLEGDDAYFRSKAEEQIKAACLTMPELNYCSYDCSAVKGSGYSEIVAAISAVPFMAEKRVVRLTGFNPTEADYQKYFAPLFESFPQTTVLVIVNQQGKKNIDLKRKKAVTYVDCNRADREMVAKWVYLTLKRAGVSISADACEAVADYCLCDMSRVSKEAEKLIEWGKDGTVTTADVDLLVYKDADYRMYQMTAAVAGKDYSAFIEICRDLLTRGLDENAVLASLINYFKTLLTVLTSDEPATQIASRLKMTDYVFGKNRRQAQAIGEEKLVRYINSLYSLISSFKSGQIKGDGALECAISAIFFP